MLPSGSCLGSVFPFKKSRTASAEVPTAMTAFFSSMSVQANFWHQYFSSFRSCGLTLSLAKGRRLNLSEDMFLSFQKHRRILNSKLCISLYRTKEYGAKALFLKILKFACARSASFIEDFNRRDSHKFPTQATMVVCGHFDFTFSTLRVRGRKVRSERANRIAGAKVFQQQFIDSLPTC